MGAEKRMDDVQKKKVQVDLRLSKETASLMGIRKFDEGRGKS